MGANTPGAEKTITFVGMDQKRTFPAKVLLFGEHVVLRGGRGLAVPFPGFSLRWARAGVPDERLARFAEWCAGLKVDWLDADAFRADVAAGWRLAGDIPLGYGLGSSGAVVAAVYDRFGAAAGAMEDSGRLRRRLATLENHFHGHSSGTDPYVILQNQATVIGGPFPKTVYLPKNLGQHFFLLDTGVARDGSRYIETFTKRYDGGRETRRIDEQWLQPSGQAIDALLRGDWPTTYRHFAQIADYQADRFYEFFPPTADLYLDGRGYRVKLCGAGGGGMLLGMFDPEAATIDLPGELDLLPLNV